MRLRNRRQPKRTLLLPEVATARSLVYVHMSMGKAMGKDKDKDKDTDTDQTPDNEATGGGSVRERE